MSRRMYVHVGCPKTGTSYLQTIFWASVEALRAQGLVLPLDKTGQFQAMLALRGLLDPAVDPPSAFTALDGLADALTQITQPKALITQESLAPATPEQISRLYAVLADFEVHVVITARDLARQLPSVWQQRLKKRLRLSYHEFCTAVRDGGPDVSDFWQTQDVAGIAARWGATLPPEHVHVVTVPPPGAPPGLLLDRFCAALGCDSSRLQGVEETRNRSLGAQQAELLRRVNLELGDRLVQLRGDYRQVVKRYFVKHVLSRQDGKALGVPADLENWCRDVSIATVERLRAGRYDVVGDLGELVPPLVADTSSADDTGDTSVIRGVSEADVAAAAVSALAEVLVERHRDLEQLAVLRSRTQQQQQRLRQQALEMRTRKPPSRRRR